MIDRSLTSILSPTQVRHAPKFRSCGCCRAGVAAQLALRLGTILSGLGRSRQNVARNTRPATGCPRGGRARPELQRHHRQAVEQVLADLRPAPIAGWVGRARCACPPDRHWRRRGRRLSSSTRSSFAWPRRSGRRSRREQVRRSRLELAGACRVGAVKRLFWPNSSLPAAFAMAAQ